MFTSQLNYIFCYFKITRLTKNKKKPQLYRKYFKASKNSERQKKFPHCYEIKNGFQNVFILSIYKKKPHGSDFKNNCLYALPKHAIAVQ